MGNAQRARVSLLGMNFRTVAAAVGISLLSACSAVDSVREVVVPPETPLVDVSEPSPSETEVPVEEVIEVVEPPEPESPSAEAWEDDHRDLEPQLVEPDPALVESMECLPVPEGSLEFATDSTQAGQNGVSLIDSAMVEVGEGLNPGETWWLVALAFEEPTLGRVQIGDSPVVRLTNQPGLPEGERGSWIMSRKDDRGRHMWHHVKWEDEESFVRLQSAATKALDCVHPA